MSEMVKVACRVPNGLALRLHRETTSPESGEKRFVPCSDFVVVGGPGPHAEGPAHTDVDEVFWDAWLKQNPSHASVVNGDLVSINDQPKGGR